MLRESTDFESVLDKVGFRQKLEATNFFPKIQIELLDQQREPNFEVNAEGGWFDQLKASKRTAGDAAQKKFDLGV